MKASKQGQPPWMRKGSPGEEGRFPYGFPLRKQKCYKQQVGETGFLSKLGETVPQQARLPAAVGKRAHGPIILALEG